ncbi:Sugar transferase involved in LPS biosynthesis (colanic, teichoic acid) [Cribrihabitans marinus]|uniref:Sugar transferase involved in LPS biosynthesis (Colanic, teichoic acid) n=1 Tax=Cribrihabitans marinus TaxID=1227549 RepID=A0A1H6SNT0_9RHOB|nr:sugar transferase [Cribrihabitans marinus]GGH23211.1 sugar transferase [Cribrihabitans marinus]SEI68576.1 Sugar transferase involved in LPS biosynthesis (colanic, teichoic acid) [Cribrihabitans marinus]
MKDIIDGARVAPAGHVWVGPASFGVGVSASAVDPANLNGPFRASPIAPPRRRSWYSDTGKRVFDVALILVTLPVTLTLIGLCALALALDGGHPFYWQDRLGRSGRRFRIVKLRTMVLDADARLERLLEEDPDLRAEWDATQKLKCDPRITRVGDFMRRSSLDELPQIWNVLRGEMSIVGPRPMLPEQLSMYDTPEAYFSMRPGLTGAWQVSSRNEDRFGLRAKLDAGYAATLSFWGDLGLIWRTFGVVLRRTGY